MAVGRPKKKRMGFAASNRKAAVVSVRKAGIKSSPVKTAA
jgi:hypothetical protein